MCPKFPSPDTSWNTWNHFADVYWLNDGAQWVLTFQPSLNHPLLELAVNDGLVLLHEGHSSSAHPRKEDIAPEAPDGGLLLDLLAPSQSGKE